MDVVLPYRIKNEQKFFDCAFKLGFDEMTVHKFLYMFHQSDVDTFPKMGEDRISVLIYGWGLCEDYRLTLKDDEWELPEEIEMMIKILVPWSLDIWFSREWDRCRVMLRYGLIYCLNRARSLLMRSPDMMQVNWEFLLLYNQTPWQVPYLRSLTVKKEKTLETGGQTIEMEELPPTSEDLQYIKLEQFSLIVLRLVKLFDQGSIDMVKTLCMRVLSAWNKVYNTELESAGSRLPYVPPEDKRCLLLICHIYLMAVYEADDVKGYVIDNMINNIRFYYQSFQTNTSSYAMDNMSYTPARFIALTCIHLRLQKRELFDFYIWNSSESPPVNLFGVVSQAYKSYLLGNLLMELNNMNEECFASNAALYKRLMNSYVNEREKSEIFMIGEMQKLDAQRYAHNIQNPVKVSDFKSKICKGNRMSNIGIYENADDMHDNKDADVKLPKVEEVGDEEGLEGGEGEELIVKDTENDLSVDPIFQNIPNNEEILYYVYDVLSKKSYRSWQFAKIVLLFKIISHELNMLETWRYHPGLTTKFMLNLEAKLSEHYIDLAKIFKDYPFMEQEFWLTAFYLNPTQQSYEAIKRLGIRNNRKRNEEPTTTEAKYGLLSSTIDVKEIVVLTNADDQNADYIPLTEALHSLNLPDSVIKDILTVIFLPRNRGFSWAVEWNDLRRRCKMLMTNTHEKKRFVELTMAEANDRLKFLNIDYEKYKNRPQLDYGSIEQGYENLTGDVDGHSDDSDEEEDDFEDDEDVYETQKGTGRGIKKEEEVEVVEDDNSQEDDPYLVGRRRTRARTAAAMATLLSSSEMTTRRKRRLLEEEMSRQDEAKEAEDNEEKLNDSKPIETIVPIVPSGLDESTAEPPVIQKRNIRECLTERPFYLNSTEGFRPLVDMWNIEKSELQAIDDNCVSLLESSCILNRFAKLKSINKQINPTTIKTEEQTNEVEMVILNATTLVPKLEKIPEKNETVLQIHAPIVQQGIAIKDEIKEDEKDPQHVGVIIKVETTQETRTVENNDAAEEKTEDNNIQSSQTSGEGIGQEIQMAIDQETIPTTSHTGHIDFDISAAREMPQTVVETDMDDKTTNKFPLPVTRSEPLESLRELYPLKDSTNEDHIVGITSDKIIDTHLDETTDTMKTSSDTTVIDSKENTSLAEVVEDERIIENPILIALSSSLASTESKLALAETNIADDTIENVSVEQNIDVIPMLTREEDKDMAQETCTEKDKANLMENTSVEQHIYETPMLTTEEDKDVAQETCTENDNANVQGNVSVDQNIDVIPMLTTDEDKDTAQETSTEKNKSNLMEHTSVDQDIDVIPMLTTEEDKVVAQETCTEKDKANLTKITSAEQKIDVIPMPTTEEEKDVAQETCAEKDKAKVQENVSVDQNIDDTPMLTTEEDKDVAQETCNENDSANVLDNASVEQNIDVTPLLTTEEGNNVPHETCTENDNANVLQNASVEQNIDVTPLLTTEEDKNVPHETCTENDNTNVLENASVEQNIDVTPLLTTKEDKNVPHETCTENDNANVLQNASVEQNIDVTPLLTTEEDKDKEVAQETCTDQGLPGKPPSDSNESKLTIEAAASRSSAVYENLSSFIDGKPNISMEADINLQKPSGEKTPTKDVCLTSLEKAPLEDFNEIKTAVEETSMDITEQQSATDENSPNINESDLVVSDSKECENYAAETVDMLITDLDSNIKAVVEIPASQSCEPDLSLHIEEVKSVANETPSEGSETVPTLHTNEERLTDVEDKKTAKVDEISSEITKDDSPLFSSEEIKSPTEESAENICDPVISLGVASEDKITTVEEVHANETTVDNAVEEALDTTITIDISPAVLDELDNPDIDETVASKVKEDTPSLQSEEKNKLIEAIDKTRSNDIPLLDTDDNKSIIDSTLEPTTAIDINLLKEEHLELEVEETNVNLRPLEKDNKFVADTTHETTIAIEITQLQAEPLALEVEETTVSLLPLEKENKSVIDSTHETTTAIEITRLQAEPLELKVEETTCSLLPLEKENKSAADSAHETTIAIEITKLQAEPSELKAEETTHSLLHQDKDKDSQSDVYTTCTDKKSDDMPSLDSDESKSAADYKLPPQKDTTDMPTLEDSVESEDDSDSASLKELESKNNAMKELCIRRPLTVVIPKLRPSDLANLRQPRVRLKRIRDVQAFLQEIQPKRKRLFNRFYLDMDLDSSDSLMSNSSASSMYRPPGRPSKNVARRTTVPKNRTSDSDCDSNKSTLNRRKRRISTPNANSNHSNNSARSSSRGSTITSGNLVVIPRSASGLKLLISHADQKPTLKRPKYKPPVVVVDEIIQVSSSSNDESNTMDSIMEVPEDEPDPLYEEAVIELRKTR